MEDPYHVLGLSRMATDDEIERAYRRLAKDVHPDRIDGSDIEAVAAATAAFVRLNEAHRVLTDVDLRLRWHLRHPDPEGATAPPTDQPRPPRRTVRNPTGQVTARRRVAGFEVRDRRPGGRVTSFTPTTVGRVPDLGLWVLCAEGKVAPDGLFSDREVFTISAYRARLRASHLEEIRANPTLRRLDLGATNVDDRGVDRVCDLPKLEQLRIDETAVTDEVCRSLARLPELEDLSLRDTEVGDAGLRLLADSPHLHTIDLRGTRVTERGLSALDAMTLHRVSLPFRLTLLNGLRAFRIAHPDVTVI